MPGLQSLPSQPNSSARATEFAVCPVQFPSCRDPAHTEHAQQLVGVPSLWLWLDRRLRHVATVTAKAQYSLKSAPLCSASVGHLILATVTLVSKFKKLSRTVLLPVPEARPLMCGSIWMKSTCSMVASPAPCCRLRARAWVSDGSKARQGWLRLTLTTFDGQWGQLWPTTVL